MEQRFNEGSTMSYRSDEGTVGFLLVISIISLVGFISVTIISSGNYRIYERKAVKNGAATWVLNEETGAVVFTWNDEKDKTEK